MQRTLFETAEERTETASPGIDTMPPRDASDLVWHGDGAALLAFATAMGVRPMIDAAMDAYNAGIAGNPMAIPFESTAEFIADPAIRAAIAGAYNDKRAGRNETYADALAGRRLSPRKPPMRGLAEAFRFSLRNALGDGRKALDTAAPRRYNA